MKTRIACWWLAVLFLVLITGRALAQPVPEAARPGARVELSVVSAPLGAAMGSLVCGLAECGEPRPWAGANLGGAAGAVALSALITRDRGLSFPTAQAIEGGAVWGAATSVYSWMLLGRHGDATKGLLAGLLAGELAGAGLGAVVERGLRPSASAVALSNSGALWLPAMTVMFTFSAELNASSERLVRGLGGGLLAAEAVGLGLGGFIGQRFGATRGQVWLGDAGAVLGGGAMPLLTWLVAGEGVTGNALLASTAVGIGLGFASAYALSLWLPKRERSAARREGWFGAAQLAAVPLDRGGMLQLSARLH